MYFLKKLLDILFPASEVETKLIAMCDKGNVPRALPVQHNNIFAAANYHDAVIRASIRVLKTRRNTPIAQRFARLVHEHIAALLQDKEPFTTYEKIIIVPIPITKNRLRERGFNQTILIANELIKFDEKYSLENILTKTLETKKQAVSISKAKRKENIKGCFECKNKNENKQQGEKHSSRERPGPKSTLYVVLDDVVTTGATINEAMVTLGHAKYKPVIGIAVAH